MIFVIGLNKTGTTSIAKALEIATESKRWKARLQYKIFKEKNNFNDFAKEIKLKYDRGIVVFKDRPWNMGIYKELYEYFPNAKFVLTIRDANSWWESVIANLNYKKNDDLIFTYKHHFKSQSLNKENFISYYNKYNSDVKKFFKNNKNFFILKLSKDFNWENIIKILNISEKDLRKKILKYQDQIKKQKFIKKNINSSMDKWLFLKMNKRKI